MWSCQTFMTKVIKLPKMRTNSRLIQITGFLLNIRWHLICCAVIQIVRRCWVEQELGSINVARVIGTRVWSFLKELKGFIILNRPNEILVVPLCNSEHLPFYYCDYSPNATTPMIFGQSWIVIVWTNMPVNITTSTHQHIDKDCIPNDRVWAIEK